MKLDEDRLVPDATRIASRIMDGEAIVIDLQTGTYYSLAGCGARVWAALMAHATLDEIVEQLVEAFGADPDAARADTRALLEKLAAASMLSTSSRSEALPDAETPALPQAGGYQAPELCTYDDMEELLALDPPTPGALDNLMRRPLDEAGD